MSDLFPKATNFNKGYDERSVADFFQRARQVYEQEGPSDSFDAETIRTAAFPLVRGGYDTRTVDGALGRLEAAFVHKDRSSFIAERGETEWFNKVAEDATVLYPRLLRPGTERFRHPLGKGLGYSCSEVDALLDRLADFFDDSGRITESDIRLALFSDARGEKAYDQAQVDAYLGRAVQILMAVS